MYIELETDGTIIKVETISAISVVTHNEFTECVFFTIFLQGGKEIMVGCGDLSWFDIEATSENIATVKRDRALVVKAFKAANEEFTNFSYTEDGGL